MKNTLLKSLLISALFITCPASAKMYKGFDAEGNVIYSDTPFEDAETYIPPTISVVETPQVKEKKQAAQKEIDTEKKKLADFKYTKFDITSPANKQTIWNEPDLTVSLQLAPALSTAQGHQIWLSLDNKPRIKNSQSSSFQIGRLDRGAHQLQALIKDKNGKVVVRSRTIVFFIQHGAAR